MLRVKMFDIAAILLLPPLICQLSNCSASINGSIYVAGLGKVGTTPFSGSNVLYFELADGCTFIIRPSGTEPKIKIYLLVKGSDMAQCEERIEKYFDYANALGK